MLVDYAEYKNVLVYGKIMKFDEINVIIAEKIEPLE